MSNINFRNVGACLGFQMKLLKVICDEDEARVKDYLCAAFSGYNPIYKSTHPCDDAICKGISFLVSRGWKVGTAEWKTIGIQLVCISPKDEYFHSNYNHDTTQ